MKDIGFRIDPSNNGIDIVDVRNGGERVNIMDNEIDILIFQLVEVKKSKNVI